MLLHAPVYNAEAAPDGVKRVSRAVGHESAVQGLFELARANGAPIALKDIGMREDQLDHAADLAYSNAYWNPRPLEHNAIRALLQRAFEGSAPKP